MKKKTKMYFITTLKLFAFLFTVLIGMSYLSLTFQPRTAYAATQTLAEKASDPYYKCKYAYLHKDTSALLKSELTFYKS